jgi:hypothetical protein
MHFVLNVQVDWDVDREDRRVVVSRLTKLFGRFRQAFPTARVARFGGWVNLMTEDENDVWAVANWMENRHEKYQVFVLDCWTIDEMLRARWLPLISAAGIADVDDAVRPLNRFPRIQCNTCGRYDVSEIPSPYKVSLKTLQKKADLFKGQGLLIARAPVKDLLRALIPDQLEWGETCVVDSRGRVVQRAITEDFFWIRPKHRIGRDIRETVAEHCPKCGLPMKGGGLYYDVNAKIWHNTRITVEDFGKKNWQLAVVGTQLPYALDIVVSGGLWAYLYNCGVRGLVLPKQGLNSANGEPAIEHKRRLADLTCPKEDRALRLKMWWQKEKW